MEQTTPLSRVLGQLQSMSNFGMTNIPLFCVTIIRNDRATYDGIVSRKAGDVTTVYYLVVMRCRAE